jgi:4-amino-4-deoxy-L-arabinose transferase-like glycosyltransferase
LTSSGQPPVANRDGRLRQLALIVLFAIALRLVVGMLILPDRLDPRLDHWEFDYEVGTIAHSIVSGHGFSDPYPFFGPSGPSAIIPPVCPYLLAGIFEIFGEFTKASAIAALFLNCLFSSLTAIPLYYIAKKCFSERAAIWAARIWAVFPYSVYWAAIFFWITSLTTLLLAILVLWALDLQFTSRLRSWFLFGLLAGFAALGDPVVLSTVPFILAWICYRRAVRRAAWKVPAAVAVLALMIAPAPWTIRNTIVFHKPVLLRDTFWVAFRISNSGNSLHWEDDSAVPAKNPVELQEMARVGEMNYMKEKEQQSLAFLRENPGLYARLVFRRIVYIWTGYWSLRPDYLKLEPYDPANIPFDTAVTILTCLGLRRLFKEKNEARWLFVLVLLMFPLIYYFTDPLQRRRGPVEPEMVMLCVYAFLPRLGTETKPTVPEDLEPAPPGLSFFAGFA